MVRFVLGVGLRHHVGNEDLQQLSWLSVLDCVKFYKTLHLFHIQHNLAPSYLMPNFSVLANCHSYETCGSSCNFQLPREMSRSICSFTFTAAKQWNALRKSLKEISEFRVFKKKIEGFLALYI